MARPRVFISSTYYDLKHLRASLDVFVESLGFESILSEKGDIAYSPDVPLDESCYREAESSDILVLIIGGRYGSHASSEDSSLSEREFFDRYDSITKKEIEAAIQKDIPVYILIESSVYSEHQTYLKNRGNKEINYAHVDSVNIFELISNILSLPKNNPVKTFEKFSDIEYWLREQWAGLFREFLQKSTQQRELSALNEQVRSLEDINSTLKSYLETIIRSINPSESEELIASETEKLVKRNIHRLLSSNDLYEHLNINYDMSIDEFASAFRKSGDLKSLINNLEKNIKNVLDNDSYKRERFSVLKDLLLSSTAGHDDIKQAAEILEVHIKGLDGGKESQT